MYAAISVLPWPGSSACQAPNATASSEPEEDQHDAVVVHERARTPRGHAGPGRVRPARPRSAAAPTDIPGANDACIVVTCERARQQVLRVREQRVADALGRHVGALERPRRPRPSP